MPDIPALTLNAIAPLLAAADVPSAGGAATRDVVIATFFMAVPTTALVLLMLAYRNGRARWIGRYADWAGELGDLPYWAALPSGIIAISLIGAVFGLWWDVAYHIKFGRDDGPLANPSHYLIMFALLGIFWAGVIAMALPRPGERPSPWAVRIAGDWYAPVGGVLIMASSAIALAGFPLDDLWHRWFGQDVTLWSPTHLVMLSGAVFTLLGESILLVEGARSMDARRNKQTANDHPPERRSRLVALESKARRAAACGGLLLGTCVYQAEFDYGVPQFKMVFAPMLVLFGGAMVLVLARIWVGRFGALAALLLYVPMRTALVLFAGPITGTLSSTFPLFVVVALMVELAAVLVSPRRPVAFAVAAGVLIGTVGLAVEWWWSTVFARYEWSTEMMLPEGVVLGLLMAICGAQIGAWMGRSLSRNLPTPTGAARLAAPAALAVAVILIAYGLLSDRPRTDLTAVITTTEARVDAPGRWVDARIAVSDPAATDDLIWAKQIAWQGPGFETADLVRESPGVYVTSRPLPVSGKWKSAFRLHTKDGLLGVPVYEPADPAIPAPGVPAPARAERRLRPDREILQRESKIEPGPAATAGYTLLFLLLGGLVALQAWGIARIGRGAPPEPPGAAAPVTAAARSHPATGSA